MKSLFIWVVVISILIYIAMTAIYISQLIIMVKYMIDIHKIIYNLINGEIYYHIKKRKKELDQFDLADVIDFKIKISYLEDRLKRNIDDYLNLISMNNTLSFGEINVYKKGLYIKRSRFYDISSEMDRISLEASDYYRLHIDEKEIPD